MVLEHRAVVFYREQVVVLRKDWLRSAMWPNQTVDYKLEPYGLLHGALYYAVTVGGDERTRTSDRGFAVHRHLGL